MRKVTFRNLSSNRRRLIGTVLGIVLGVAFLSGTMVLSDTITRTFNTLFADVNAGTDAWVRSSDTIEAQFQVVRARVDESLVQTVAGVDGVQAAEGQVMGFAQVVGKDGEPIGNPDMGAPTFGGNWSTVEGLNPFHLVQGRAPRAVEDVVLDKKTADDGKLSVGDRTTVLTEAGPIKVLVVGIAKFGDLDSPGGASFASFTLPAAQRYIAEPGKLDAVAAVADSGVSETDLVSRIERALPTGVEAITGAELTKENQDDIQQGLSFFTVFLSAFAGIALLVATFSIYNTFSIIIAQRTRQMALLRALGASRSQVLRSVLLEAVATGLLASVIGLVVGIGLAGVLKGLLSAFGFDIPAGGTVLKPDTVITALLVGVLVTLVASLAPAVKASRIAPIAALREAAIESTRPSKVRIVIGVLVTLAGAGLVVSSLSAKTATDALGAAGQGAVLLIIATLILGPVMARPIAGLLALPIQRARGFTGRLVRENAMRNPRRTSGAAAALLIGVTVVALMSVFASSIKASVADQVNRSFGGDLVVDSGTFGVGGFNPTFIEQVRALPEVETATSLRFGVMRIADDDKSISVVDPATGPGVFDLEVQQGSLAALGESAVGVSDTIAEEKGYRIGTTLPATFPDGFTTQLTIATIYGAQDVAGNWIIGQPAWNAHAVSNTDAIILLNLRNGVSLQDGKAAVIRVAADYPGAKVQDRDAFAEEAAGFVNQLLALVYVMLTLAILIALFGIANTLSLSVHERTRELGLLRAVGMTRGQLRSTVRWEAVVIAVFGAIGGLGLGVFLAWALVKGAGKGGFTTFQLPIGTLIIVLVIAGIAGLLAGVRAASRAAKLDILTAVGSN
ncbi:MAG: putative transport system permease protein [Actinomycetota bacterium]|jgi:putative ABC transport system permease protein